jgi:ketosteroid isomerase-like protein
MNLLLEQPLAIVIVGVVLGLVAGTAWTSTGRKGWLVGLGLVVVLTIAGLIVERLVVTDREAIEATLAEIARDVQSNDLRAVLRHVSSNNPELQQKAEAEMPNYRFDECRVTKIFQLDIDASAEPRSALVEFNVIASGSFQQGGVELADRGVPRRVLLQMVREKDGRWRVQDYAHSSPLENLDADALTDPSPP